MGKVINYIKTCFLNNAWKYFTVTENCVEPDVVTNAINLKWQNTEHCVWNTKINEPINLWIDVLQHVVALQRQPA